MVIFVVYVKRYIRLCHLSLFCREKRCERSDPFASFLLMGSPVADSRGRTRRPPPQKKNPVIIKLNHTPSEKENVQVAKLNYQLFGNPLNFSPLD